MIKPWKQLSSRIGHDNPHSVFKIDEFENGNGDRGMYYYIDKPEAVDIFAQQKDGKFVMIKEWRYLIKRVSISCPMGGVEEGETVEEAAKRELLEETGYQAGEILFLQQHVSVPAFSTERTNIFFASNLKKLEQQTDEFEEIEVVLMTAGEIDQAIDSGDIWDSNVISSWYTVKRHLERIDQKDDES